MNQMPLIFYILFIVLAMPLELHLYVWGGWGTELAMRPLSEALVYYYAIVLATEAGFRAVHHREAFKRGSLIFLGSACGIVFFLFVVHYMGALLPEIRAGKHVEYSWPLQILVAAIALATSVLSYGAIERAKPVAIVSADIKPGKGAIK